MRWVQVSGCYWEYYTSENFRIADIENYPEGSRSFSFDVYENPGSCVFGSVISNIETVKSLIERIVKDLNLEH